MQANRVSTLPRFLARFPRLALALLACAALPTSGCYYAHLAHGQARILLARQSIADMLAANGTSPELAERLRLAGAVRKFAAGLGLDVGAQYTSYVDWPGDRVVTSVVATRPGEIEARGFWFPLVGRVPYKGYFDQDRAESEAAHLASEGLDTCLVPVVAYSTLGWMADPLTAPLARSPRLAETLIHELVHATVFEASEPDFNEGLATFVGQEGVIRFVAARDGDGEAARERTRVAEDRRVAGVLEAFRDAVASLYATTEPGTVRGERRAALEASTREELRALPLATRDSEALGRDIRLNDACQALIGTYQGDLPRYEAVLEALGGDLGRFVELARKAARESDPRAALLAPPG
ncbi:MAG TPA: aminopeptidase [Myxococcota bacterium]|nr:aminopeptidase [Myxococcota bacterium]